MEYSMLQEGKQSENTAVVVEEMLETVHFPYYTHFLITMHNKIESQSIGERKADGCSFFHQIQKKIDDNCLKINKDWRSKTSPP